jgi:hypothetical protein
MTTPLESELETELEAFIATSAAMLGLQLDDRARAAVLDAMRGVMNQAALVLDYPDPPAST